MDLSDADLVDVIHTNPGQLPNKGIDIPIGHFDYYIGQFKLICYLITFQNRQNGAKIHHVLTCLLQKSTKCQRTNHIGQKTVPI